MMPPPLFIAADAYAALRAASACRAPCAVRSAGAAFASVPRRHARGLITITIFSHYWLIIFAAI
jgi:hypothetical protein